MSIQVVILAAGQGKRMYSNTPKILHCLAGKPLLAHVIDAAQTVSETQPIIIYGHQGDTIRETFKSHKLKWVEQKEQLGTAHAVGQALSHLDDDARVLIMYGDVPLISAHTLNDLVVTTPLNALGMLTAQAQHPKGYGRIKRDANNNIVAIVEEKDATESERLITEINPGIYLISATHLKKWLPSIENKNAQNEYYLTDIIALAVKEGVTIHSVVPQNFEEILGVNNCSQLAALERFYQHEQANKWMLKGVTLRDPARFDIRGEVEIGRDVVIDINVILEGRVVIGDGCIIGANTVLRDTELASEVEIKENSLIEGAVIAAQCKVGPFARIRPDTFLSEKVHIGNFVEIKKSRIGAGTKINHLTYVGDSVVGKAVNIGVGTITCNYDGVNKHATIVGDNVFIGSSTQLVAPVRIGEGATIGAGSTITKDAPAHKLTLSRPEQVTVENWLRPEKTKV